MTEEIIFPDATRWYVKVLRFLNTLDSDHNMLSPVKLNVWAANLATVCAAASTALGWMGGHAAEVWTPMMSWLTHAHAYHHFDKRERNRTAIEMAKAQK